MRRTLFTEDHEAFRELARDFIEQEVVPAYPRWEKAGRIPREAFERLGATGRSRRRLGQVIGEHQGSGGPCSWQTTAFTTVPAPADRTGPDARCRRTPAACRTRRSGASSPT